MNKNPGVTEQLARFIANTKPSKIPDAAIDAAAVGVLDCVGTALAATTRKAGRIIIRHVSRLGGERVARVIGTDVKTFASNAALANGTLAHADDYDDVCDFGHPSAVLMPTVLALGEQLRSSGRDVLSAYVLGFETGVRINAGVGAGHYRRGWHSTSTIGTMAAAAAASSLLGLDVTQTRTALGIAASHAAGVQANFGTMTKPLHAGNAARNGIVAAQLADSGYTANLDVIESPLGYAAVFEGANSSSDRMTEKLGVSYSILAPGIRIKRWPTCYGNHAAIFLTVDLITRHKIKPEQVRNVEFYGVDAIKYLDRPSVRTGLDGKFSFQYNIAAAVADSGITHETFSDRKIRDPKIRSMMKRVVLRKNSLKNKILSSGNPADPLQTLSIRLKDGSLFSGTAKAEAGTLSGYQVDEKFISNAILAIPACRAENALRILHDLKDLRDVTELMDSTAAD